MQTLMNLQTEFENILERTDVKSKNGRGSAIMSPQQTGNTNF